MDDRDRDPGKLADQLEEEVRELQERDEKLGEQLDAARGTWRSHRETAAPPAPDAPGEHAREQGAPQQGGEEESSGSHRQR